ncbi:MAG: peptidylprolyl isomerase [Saprospiraceae bacterium]
MRALLVFLLFAELSCRPDAETVALIRTDYGDISVRLFNHTPRHRDNFIRLARSGFYDSLLFHRVVRDFTIQGGDPDSRSAARNERLGGGGPGYELEPEIRAPHLKGALAAARRPDAVNPGKGSNGAQFFIVQGIPQTDESLDLVERRTGKKIEPALRAQYLRQGGAPELDGRYTVFGAVIQGMEVIDRIAAVPRDEFDRPLKDIRMRVELVGKR